MRNVMDEMTAGMAMAEHYGEVRGPACSGCGTPVAAGVDLCSGCDAVLLEAASAEYERDRAAFEADPATYAAAWTACESDAGAASEPVDDGSNFDLDFDPAPACPHSAGPRLCARCAEDGDDVAAVSRVSSAAA